MSIGLLFWIIMIVGLLLWGWTFAQPQNPYSRFHPGVWWVLLALLGWGVFGPPIHG